MRIIKYSRISKINLGDVMISESINCIDKELLKNNIYNQDILFENFDLNKRINDSKLQHNTIDYKVKNYGLLKFLVYIYKRLYFIFKDKNKIVQQIRESDAVIVGGGNIIGETYSNDMFFRICQIAKIARKNNKDFYVIAVGIGELKFKYKKRLKKIINNSQVFSVRDNISKNICNQIPNLNKKIEVLIDPAFVISDYYPIINKESKYIGFNFMNLKRINQNDTHNISKIAHNLKKLNIYYNKPIKIINTSFGEDLSVSRLIKSELDDLGVHCKIFNILSVNDLPAAFCDIEFFIANRMHSSIFAMSYNIKTLIYPWDKKILALNKILFGKNKAFYVQLSSINIHHNEIIEKIDNYDNNVDLKHKIDIIKGTIRKKYLHFFIK